MKNRRVECIKWQPKTILNPVYLMENMDAVPTSKEQSLAITSARIANKAIEKMIEKEVK